MSDILKEERKILFSSNNAESALGTIEQQINQKKASKMIPGSGEALRLASNLPALDSYLSKHVLDEPDWEALLQCLVDKPEFAKYFKMYRGTVENSPSVKASTFQLVNLVRLKKYGQLLPTYESIQSPNAEALRAFISGLLQSPNPDHLAHARLHILELLRSEGLADPMSCEIVLRRLGEEGDFAGCSEVWEAAMERAKRDEGACVFELGSLVWAAPAVRGSEDLAWLVEAAKAIPRKGHGNKFSLLKPSTDCVDAVSYQAILLALLRSPWFLDQENSSFSPKLLFQAMQDLGACTPTRTALFKVVERCSSSTRHLLELLLAGWNEADFSLVALTIHDGGWVGGKRSAVDVAEQAIGKAIREGGKDEEELLKLSGTLAIMVMKRYGRFDFELAGLLVDRLLFFSQHALASDLVLALFSSAKSTASSSACNRLLKSLYQHGHLPLIQKLMDRLSALPSRDVVHLKPSLAFGRKLLASEGDRVQAQDLSEVPQVIAAAKSLAGQGELKRAIQLIDEWERGEERDQADLRVLLPAKLELLAKSASMSEAFLACLDQLVVLYPEAESLVAFARAAVSGEVDLPAVAYSGAPAVGTRIVNAILQQVCRHQSLARALQARAVLYKRLQMDLSSYKIYAHALLQHHLRTPPEELLETPLPLDVLGKVEAAGLKPDMDMFGILVEYATALHSLQQVNGLLHNLLNAGASPTRRIFSLLFAWLQKQGANGPGLPAALDLVAMARRCGTAPPAAGFDALVSLGLEAGRPLEELRAWILEAAQQPYGKCKCSRPIVTLYFERFYMSNPLDRCLEELDTLLRVGYELAAEVYGPFLEQAMAKGDAQSARLIFNRLLYQKRPPALEQCSQLAELLLRDGSLDATHRVFRAIQFLYPASQLGTYEAWLHEKLPRALEERPDLLEAGLRAPHAKQPMATVTRSLLAYLNRSSTVTTLNPGWCRATLESLLSRGDFFEAQQLGTYMMSKRIAWPESLAEAAGSFWSGQRRIVDKYLASTHHFSI